jgi:hypothetical protein
MEKSMIPETIEAFAKLLTRQRRRRRTVKKRLKEKGLLRRRTLSPREREQVLARTGQRCHICGGKIDGLWQADHVLAHSAGGVHAAENYLPAHALCNKYRWDYSSAEFQEILKLGVWLRTQIIRLTPIGSAAGERYLAYERAREKRRKTS